MYWVWASEQTTADEAMIYGPVLDVEGSRSSSILA